MKIVCGENTSQLQELTHKAWGKGRVCVFEEKWKEPAWLEYGQRKEERQKNKVWEKTLGQQAIAW